MLALARGKLAPGGGNGQLSRQVGPRPRLATADAVNLPFADGRFAGATVAFGLRNVADLDRCLGEIARVLEPRGRVAFLEFALPESRLIRRPYLFYFRRILPRIGALLSPRGSAYAYLPSSVVDFPQREAFTRRLEAAGFDQARWRNLSGGTVCLYTGRKP
jgi:demethylmenaquinone methyltransferase/2-methoxy-6-polyprenyl-1,4-benzoquinol methylase